MLNSQERRIINSCQTCRNPIYEGEPIYTSSKGQSSGYTKGAYGGRSFGDYQAGAYGGHYGGTHVSESWAQCSWCYWQVEIAANKRFWIKWWLGGILLAVIATIASIFMFPGMEESRNSQPSTPSTIPWHRIKIFSLGSWEIPLIAPIVLAVSLLLVSILGNLFQPSVDRYKLRRRPAKPAKL